MAKSTERADYKITEELGGLETLNASYQRQKFSRHTHEGYTVGVIETGAQRFYRNGGDHVASENSIILVNADEVHDGCAATENGWSYKAMYPLPEQFARINDELERQTKGAPYFPCPVVQDKKIADLLRLTFHTLNVSDNRLLRETMVYTTLVQLILRHSKSRRMLEPQVRAQSQMVLVKSFLDDQPDADVSLEDLAELAGLSPFYLVRQFQRQYGLPPHAYQIQARLRRAKNLIRQGMKLSEVAIASGFYDQSHFHRHFKKNQGVTPGQVAKEFCRKNIQDG